jgi:hypothetical protein
MTCQQINTRVISDQEYWNLFLKFNRSAAKNITNHAFKICPDNRAELDAIICWCEENTKGLIYPLQTKKTPSVAINKNNLNKCKQILTLIWY